MADPSEQVGSERIGEGWGYILLRDDAGYSIWNLRDEGDEPVAEFEPTDEGADLAWERFEQLQARGRRGRWRSRLARAAMVIGGLWLLSLLYGLVVLVLFSFGALQNVDESLYRLLTFPMNLALLQGVFLAIVGIYLVLWMRDHDIER